MGVRVPLSPPRKVAREADWVLTRRKQMSKSSDYVTKFRIKRRAKVREYLGGSCVKCGATENLEVDHIDWSTKSFTISNNLQVSWERMVKELDKCQLLCSSCHKEKTRLDHKDRPHWNRGNWKHGSITGYHKGCRCDLCKEAQSLYKKSLRARKRAREAEWTGLLNQRG